MIKRETKQNIAMFVCAMGLYGSETLGKSVDSLVEISGILQVYLLDKENIYLLKKLTASMYKGSNTHPHVHMHIHTHTTTSKINKFSASILKMNQIM